MRFLIATVLLAVSLGVQAIPVRWELPPAGGGTNSVSGVADFQIEFQLSGSFVYDADINLYSEVDLVLDDGWRAITNVSCGFGDEAANCPDQFDVTFAYVGEFDEENFGQKKAYYQLIFDAPLTNAGGEVSLIGGLYNSPANSRWIDCDWLEGCDGGIDTIEGGIVLGSEAKIIGTVVPIPAAVWLFGSGLGLLGWFRRRQTA